jgi:hypothetical protein
VEADLYIEMFWKSFYKGSKTKKEISSKKKE